jgi:hypothetical protein
MDFWIVLGAVGSVASIVGLALPLQTRHQRLMHFVYGLLVAMLASVAVWYWQATQRVHRVERVAASLVEDRRRFSEVGFTQAALAFLEKNRDLYPDTYARAQKICEQNNCFGAQHGGKTKSSLDHVFNQIDVASAMEGILRGIGKLEGGT